MKKLLSIVAAAIFMVSCGMTENKWITPKRTATLCVTTHRLIYPATTTARRRSTVFSVVQPLWEKVVHPLK